MEQATDAEKGMTVSEFLDFKRRNKVCFYLWLLYHASLYCYLLNILFLKEKEDCLTIFIGI